MNRRQFCQLLGTGILVSSITSPPSLLSSKSKPVNTIEIKNDCDGGFLVPEVYKKEILQRAKTFRPYFS